MTERRLPVKQLVILSICRFAEPIALTSVFPYIPEMMESFGVPENDIARWAGFTSAVFSISQAVTAIPWGAASDRFGRKPTILIGLFNTMVTMLLFGFSTSLPMAITARALQGLGNGNVGILRTTVAELCPWKELQPRAFSIMPLVYTVAAIFGPTLGGSLSNPLRVDPRKPRGSKFLERFPYSPPNLVAASFFTIGIITGWLFLKESSEKKKHDRDLGLIIGDSITAFVRRILHIPKKQKKIHPEREPLLSQTKVFHDEEAAPNAVDAPRRESRPRVRDVLSYQTTLNLVVYTLLALYTLAYDQIIPVFMHHPPMAINDPKVSLPFKFTGGFGIDSQRIGAIFTIFAITSVLSQFLLFPVLARRWGVLHCLRIAFLIFPVVYFLTPFVSLISDPLTKEIVMITLLIIRGVGGTFAFPTSTIMLTNSATSLRVLGTINGLATSVSAVGRATGPATIGGLFTWSLKKGYVIIPFWTLSLISLLAFIPTLWLEEGKGFGDDPDSDVDSVVSASAPSDEIAQIEDDCALSESEYGEPTNLLSHASTRDSETSWSARDVGQYKASEKCIAKKCEEEEFGACGHKLIPLRACLLLLDEELALFTSTSYNWTAGKSSTKWYFLDIKSGDVTEAPIDSSVSEVVWIGATNTSVLYINGTNDDIPGGVTLYTADLGAEELEPKLVASLNAPFSGLKAAQTESGAINFVVNTLAYNNGSAYNPDLAVTPKSSGQVYDANFIRHWDTYITAERYAVFSGVLSSGYGGYSLDGELTNLLTGINASITRPETPVQPFGDSGDYDISPDGSTVAFLTKAPELPKANYTASYIYIVPHDGSEAPVAINGPGSSAPGTAQGASEAPRWSPDSKKLAYAQQDGISYESDRFKLYVASIDGLDSEVLPVAEDWDSSPSSLAWSQDGENLWVVSELYAANRLYIVPIDADASFTPTNITGPSPNLADFAVLPNGDALISASASWSSRIFYTQGVESEAEVLFTANEVDPELAGLLPNSTTNFWYTGGDGDPIQSFVYYPSNFSTDTKWPMILIVHGGPQSSQGDSWSTRWNLRLWAEQGFVIFVPQFIGTPSYGQEFTDKITNNWGGTPYKDLVALVDHIEANVSYVDIDRAVAAGPSFGAFSINWIQGHDLGRRFKALVSHDGKLNQFGAYATDELWFIQHDQNGTIWNDRENYAIWDPLSHAANFSTPHFIIHNDLDYRVVQSEGVALFNILQSLGVPSRFLHFPDEGHWVLNRDNSLVWHKFIFNWLRYWVGLDEELISEGVITQ
ncbi:Dipeptidyl-peptidase 5 [Kalmusia sp. IMI 367209]|nr:Dipeptidyl-peptidase 5 [Kalmusia sp. IMI 367209]